MVLLYFSLQVFFFSFGPTGIDRFLGNVREMLKPVNNTFLTMMKYCIMVEVPIVMAVSIHGAYRYKLTLVKFQISLPTKKNNH